MKKSIFLGLATFAMLLTTSCVNEIAPSKEIGDTPVTFQIGTPEIATRAYSDGTTATQLQYAVYDEDGNLLDALTVKDAVIKGSTSIELQLATGNEYSIIFWAAAPNAPYTIDFANKTMTVNYQGAVCNDETRDAFYKCHTFTVRGAQTETIELKRPFAQLNIGTNDYEASRKAGYVPAYSYVKVPVSSVLNLFDGTVKESKEVEFALSAIPTTEEFPVQGYEYISMNYLLVSADKEVVDVTFGYSENNQTVENTRIVGSVPVQRNHRTNIYGQLLTSDVDVNVEIKPEYDDPALELDELQKAALNGGEVTLTEDVTLSKTLNVMADMIINLNGHTITGPSEARDADGNRVHAIVNNAKLTINGGTITSPADNGGSAIYNNAGATLIVNNVEINGAPLVAGGWPSYGINNYGTMTINGAKVNTYHGGIATGGNGITVIEDATVDVGLNTQTKQTSWALYIFENGQMTVNGGTFKNTKNENGQVYGGGYICAIETSKTIINGGTFDKTEGDNNGTGFYYQCKNLEIKGGVFDTDPSKYVADGYKAVKQGQTWYVVKDDVTVVSTDTEFQTALSSGGNIILVGDVSYNKIDLTTQTQDVYIDAQGHKITTTDSYGVQVSAGKNITLKNAEVVITKAGDYLTYAAGFKVENGDYNGKTITLDNCTIKMANADWAYAVNMPASVKNLNLVIDKCTLEGAIALQCWGDNNTITVTNSDLICNYTTNAMYTSYCVALQGDGTNKAENNILNISGCTFSYSGVDNFNSEIGSVVDRSGANTNNTINVSDCTYNNGVKAY